MTSSKKLTRRHFLSRTTLLGAGACAAPFVLPSGTLAAPGRPGPNDRIGVGYIGVGRRGKQIMNLPQGMEIVAMSDVYQARLDELAPKYPKCRMYKDYREMLLSDDVHAVVVATPDHWHVQNTVHACQAKKDVYVEKPMSLTVREGRVMVQAARENGCIVQVGSQQRSMPECRLGCELVRNGRAGKIHTVHADNYPSPWECDLPAQDVPDGLDWDMWCGQTEPRPYHEDLYLPRANPGWISFRPYSGGEMTGWGSHGLDIIQWALGKDDTGPVEVWPEGEGLECPVGFRYADGVQVLLDGKCDGGGGVFVGDAGRILVTRGRFEAQPREIAVEPLTTSDIRLYQSDNHMQNWLDCIRSRELPVADVEIGHRSTTMCHLGNIARWTGRKLQWDPAAERFVGDDDANGYLERPMRAPWSV